MKCPLCGCKMRRWNATYSLDWRADDWRKKVKVKLTWSCAHCRIYLTGDASGSLTRARVDGLFAEFVAASDAFFEEKAQCHRRFRLVADGRQTYVKEIE